MTYVNGVELPLGNESIHSVTRIYNNFKLNVLYIKRSHHIKESSKHTLKEK